MGERTAISSDRYDVVIVGAGPVGLMLACLLGARGLHVLLLEKRTTIPAHSMAIGITPPSLRLLGKLGLDADFVSRGVKVENCFIHGESGYLGRVTFQDLPGEYQFILSLPQADTIFLLQRKLAEYPTVTLCYGAEVVELSQDEETCRILYAHGSERRMHTVAAKLVAACDGSRSPVREMLGIRAVGRDYRRHFVMGDFSEDNGMHDEAHLFFKTAGSVESFPLPGGRRRWIVQTDNFISETSADFLSSVVAERCGLTPSPAKQLNQSSFTPHRFNCERYYQGRVIICGDAAHGMSPVGGQGMNTGFADAEFLASALISIVQRGVSAETFLAGYDRYRRRAAQSAISRADWGMWLGTWRGRPLSVLRDFIIRHVLCKGIISRHMGPFYAMLTIPYNSLDRVPVQALREIPI
ncbi:MAG: FAD-dependent monooxygenase [Verrucomicrobia bacterium]|nr:FAD-dependent monooxygenase [Verrucomicrobiota bacterium]